jgi:hypothetical protein
VSAVIEPPDPALWDRPDIRALLAVGDFTRVYQMLNGRGWSQQRIGILTGQQQGQVSGVINGRQPLALHVIRRISEGLGIPGCYVWPCARCGPGVPIGDPHPSLPAPSRLGVI